MVEQLVTMDCNKCREAIQKAERERILNEITILLLSATRTETENNFEEVLNKLAKKVNTLKEGK